MKRCLECGIEKDATEFWVKKTRKDGLNDACKPCARRKHQQYLKDNPDIYQTMLDKQKEPEIRARRRALIQKDAAKWQKYQLKWRLAHPEVFRVASKAWAAKKRAVDPEYFAARARNEYSLRRGSSGKVTKEEWAACLDAYNHACSYCGKDIAGFDCTQDHIMPVTRGGLHVIENIVPACRSCNARKKNKLPHEWQAYRQLITAIQVSA